MKTINLFFLALLTTIFLGCGGSSDGGSSDETNTDNSSTTTFPVDLVGKWVYADTGEEVYLTTNSTRSYTKIDDNLLKTDINRHLIRSSVAKTKLTGKLLLIPESVQLQSKRTTGYSGAAGINVILKNTNDGKVGAVTTTDSSGTFVDTSLPSGEYDLFAEIDDVHVQQTITIEEEEEDLGNYVLLGDGTHNFKTELIMNEEFLFGNESAYSGIVRVHNIGSVDGIGLNYSLDTNDSYIKLFSFEKVLGTIPAGSYKDIPFTVNFNQLLLNERDIALTTTLQDVNYNEWKDTLYFKVYRKTYRINLTSEDSNVKGYITLPNKKQLSVNMSDGYIDVPTLLEDDYYIVLANADLNQETAYSIGLETITEDLASFTDTGRYESQNGTIEGAIAIPRKSVISSYLHVGDIDFYKIEVDETAELLQQVDGAKLDTWYESNEITVDNDILELDTKASIDNGELIINGVASGKESDISLGDKLKINLRSSSEYEKEVVSTLQIGKLKTHFTLYTSFDRSYGAISFDPIVDAYPDVPYWSNKIFIEGINTGLQASISNGKILKNGVEQNESIITLKEGDSIQVRLNSSPYLESKVSSQILIDNHSYNFNISTFGENGTTVSYSFKNNEDVLPPKLISSEPAINSTTEYQKSIVTLQFNETVDLQSFKNAFSLLDENGSIVEGGMQYIDDGKTFQYTPMAKLADFSQYKIILNEGIQDVNKNKTVSRQEFTFNTGRTSKFIRYNDLNILVDINSKLIWQDDKASATNTGSWATAESYCEEYELGNYKDWRLPTWDELLGICDDAYETVVDPSFLNYGNESYWTSTNWQYDSDRAYAKVLTKGTVYTAFKYLTYLQFRCVHKPQ